MPVPNFIFSIWLGGEQPELIKKCLSTHRQKGFDYHLVTLDNYHHTGVYVQECLSNKSHCTQRQRYAKAADYLRIWYLKEYGGIYLDADVEVIKPLNDMLQCKMFCCEEENGFVSNAIIGSEAGHTVLKDYLGKVERNFRGDGDLIFQPGMFLWTELVRYRDDVVIYPPEVFLPYNHHLDRLKVTESTRTIHHFSRSWT